MIPFNVYLILPEASHYIWPIFKKRVINFHLLNTETAKDLCTTFKTITTGKQILKFICKSISPSLSKATVKKNEVRRLIVVGFKVYCNTIFTKTVIMAKAR